MSLFDERARTRNGYGLGAEPDFRYLNETARPEFECVRRLLEGWFQSYPDDDAGKRDVRQRFRSKANRQHQAVFFELYCLALLHAMGLEVQAHPTVDPNMPTKPDFLACVATAPDAPNITSQALSRGIAPLSALGATENAGAVPDVAIPNAPTFYLECRIDSQSDEETAAHVRREQLIDLLDTMESPDYLFEADIRKVGPNMPSGRKLRGFLQGILQQTSDVEGNLGMIADPYEEGWVWNDEDWEIAFTPIPKTPEIKAISNVRTIGVRTYGNIHGGLFVDGLSSFRDALEEKRPARYGNFAHPYIIAIDVLNPYTDEMDISEVLYREQSYFRPDRAQVSAVLVLRRLRSVSPASIATAAPTLWHNPGALHKFPLDLWPGPQVIRIDEFPNTEMLPGKNAREILGLEPDWPERCD